ncbi:hypoxanthine phosphoribosyltransferase [Bathymodiolus platifrons methanotrophic gill symbiont]|uniref:hypoxanthine-guanine phosphoribosyltransferase n=1 Tax=Bathymodiolus platifrons methanotrophic gill symbiont TaxID=113268 RepID=UPI000B42118B|nr:hypoxanthine-guanine phosphoribosyltransferase [Bathymodiolus platifrons methanotrophic gill symbiont]MCK5871095.1 hypoxanthine-guanine phosphoribosyltransferase [Methyloprofundus sp.]TXK94744.1 hypoxanthine-guanine phosphoribosyltransferase [Methylococcaceae bacterium CS4]TXK95161.1 hypoxanthine-guanine phosphoribosyltransferase [Methylococcaceae bacterium CS5]TXL03880.1 hypoxanthine-guanine phosphoribosyltransferase [Methylococcaceae bacterium CS3]TXL04320.1 hypoxanthine-guanine phosphori
MLNEIELIQKHARLLHTETEVEAALDLMAEDINSRLATTNPLILCVMNGGIVTTGKLMPRLNFPLTLDAINVSRYGEQTSGNELNWLQKPISSLKNRTILIIDDILDEGLTLEAIYQYCQEQGASQIYSAVLVEKQLNKSKPIQADFIGLSVADHYLYGYGMDYKGYLRNAAGIYACA